MSAIAGRHSLRGLLSFRLNIIARFSSRSIAFPFAVDPLLGFNLKLTSAKIQLNDPLRSLAAECQALVGNNSERLTSTDIDAILADVGTYSEISNPALAKRFSERDARWLDTVQRNIANLRSPNAIAVAQKLAMDAGQYAISFPTSANHLRQPLSNIFLRLVSRFPDPIDNGKRNFCTMKSPRQFLAEVDAELMYLALPSPAFDGIKAHLGSRAWREEWIRGGDAFWNEFEQKSAGQLHGRSPSRSVYLKALEQTLRSARKIKNWAIELPFETSIAASDIMETIGSIRPIKKVYTKDLSEIGRGRSTILTA